MSQAREKICVLMFHGIGVPGRPLERDEANYWVEWPVFDEMVAVCARRDSRDLIFTFDDGNASDIEAARRMRQAGLSGRFFVLVGRIGRPGYLAREDLAELVALEMEVGLHGRDHVDWRKADDATLESEVEVAREELAEMCGRRVSEIAIPYGAYNRRVWRYLEQTDFAKVHTSDRGLATATDRFVRRNPVMAWHDAGDLATLRSGRAGFAAGLRRTVMPVLKRLV